MPLQTSRLSFGGEYLKNLQNLQDIRKYCVYKYIYIERDVDVDVWFKQGI